MPDILFQAVGTIINQFDETLAAHTTRFNELGSNFHASRLRIEGNERDMDELRE